MKVSFNWLCEFVQGLDQVDPYVLADEFRLKSFEVEEVISQKEMFKKMVSGKIIKIKKHPDANKLFLVDTDIGKKTTIQIVCGCTNFQEGQTVFVALPGAKVRWHGEGDLVTLRQTNIRGQKSFGMICTAAEVGLKDLLGQNDDREACVLDEFKIGPGILISEALGLNDFIIEVDNKTLTNRPDLWGHVGIAREAAVITGKKFIYQPTQYKEKFGDQRFLVEIKNKSACSRYSGVVMCNLSVQESPYWMKKRLWSVGLRPINNLVDITNYIMMEIGEPMHAFDMKQIVGSKIIVDTIKKVQKIKALDKKEYKLPKNTVVIKDKKGILAVGGIIGGSNSEVSGSTTECFIEAANFSAVDIRRTSAAIGLRTDASTRHEKALDPEYTMQAIHRAIELILKLCSKAKVASKIIDIYPTKPKQVSINVSHEYIEKKIGTKLRKEFIKKVLKGLKFRIREKSKIYTVNVPSFRATKDIQSKDDIVEEIARIFGYENIKPSFPVAPIKPPKQLPYLRLERRLKEILAYELGFWELYLYIFEDENIFDIFGYKKEEAVQIQNAIQKDLRFLKQDLLPGLLRTVKKNERQYAQGKLFEIGRVFNNIEKTKEGLPKEIRKLALIQFDNKDSFLSLKGSLEVLFRQIGLEDRIKYVGPNKKYSFLSGRHTAIELDERPIGFVGEVGRSIVDFFRVKSCVCAAELDFDILAENQINEYTYQELPKYPAIELDISIVVPTNILWYTIKENVYTVAPDLIRSVELFDVFESSSFGNDEKSIAFRITYRSDEHTLSMEEVLPIQEKIVKMLENRFQGKIRS